MGALAAGTLVVDCVGGLALGAVALGRAPFAAGHRVVTVGADRIVEEVGLETARACVLPRAHPTALHLLLAHLARITLQKVPLETTLANRSVPTSITIFNSHRTGRTTPVTLHIVIALIVATQTSGGMVQTSHAGLVALLTGVGLCVVEIAISAAYFIDVGYCRAEGRDCIGETAFVGLAGVVVVTGVGPEGVVVNRETISIHVVVVQEPTLAADVHVNGEVISPGGRVVCFNSQLPRLYFTAGEVVGLDDSCLIRLVEIHEHQSSRGRERRPVNGIIRHIQF